MVIAGDVQPIQAGGQKPDPSVFTGKRRQKRVLYRERFEAWERGKVRPPPPKPKPPSPADAPPATAIQYTAHLTDVECEAKSTEFWAGQRAAIEEAADLTPRLEAAAMKSIGLLVETVQETTSLFALL